MLTKLFLVFAALSRVDAFLTSPSEDDLSGRSIRQRKGVKTTTNDMAIIAGDIASCDAACQAKKRRQARLARLAQLMCDWTKNKKTCDWVDDFKDNNLNELTTPFCTTVASGEYTNLVEEFGPKDPWCYKAGFEGCDDAFTYSNRFIDVPNTGYVKTNVFRKCSIATDGKCRVENMGGMDEAYSGKFVAHLCNMACVDDPDSDMCVDEIPICCDDFENCETCENFLTQQMTRRR